MWSPSRGELDKERLEGVSAVVHLAGASVAKRWTPEHKNAIRSSRVDGTKLIVDTLRDLATPATFVSASAIGFYGDAGDRVLDEDAPAGTGFLADVCRVWEEEAARAEDFTRTVRLRIGIVLSDQGGALKEMKLPFSLGLGGPIGDGSQFMSFISLDDLVALILFCLDRDEVTGAINAVAPHAVTNAEFTRALAKALSRPAFFRVPKFAMKAALGGEMAQEMLLGSARVEPKAALAAGFTFKHPTIAEAIAAALSR